MNIVILDTMVLIKWNGNNRKIYEPLGYNFTHYGETFDVRIEDLPKGSHVKIKVQCDYCGEIFEVAYYNLCRYLKDSDIIACKRCKNKKTHHTLYERYGVHAPIQREEFHQKIMDTNQLKYGASNPMQNKEVRAKFELSMMGKYGVIHALQDSEFIEKARQTCIEHFGVDNSLKSSDVQSKVKKTMKERYGVENPMDKEEFIEKAKNTCVQRYGGASSQCSPIIREKSRQTLAANGNIPVSKPEKEMVGKIQEIYGEDNCVPQYGFSGLSFDCLLNIQNCKIDVEYDGIFWHDMNPEKDKRRDYFVIKNGYKVLRFRGETKPPSYEQIKEGVDYLVNSQHNHYTINI